MFNKVLSFYTRYFALWVIIFGIAAYYWPEPFVGLKGYNTLFFALTMFGIGVVMQVEDFRNIAAKPLLVVIGVCAQFVIMPLGAFLVAKVFRLEPELTAGLVLTGAAPDAMASNVICYIAKADVAYAVSLTTVSTLLCPLLTPGLTLLLAGSQMDVPFIDMMLDVIYMVIIPLFVGFGVRHYLGRYVEKMTAVFPAISATFIIFICSLVIALNKHRLVEATGVILLSGLVLNIGGMLGGYGVGKLFLMELRQRRTLAIQVGMQNAGLGVTLALLHLGEKAALPSAAFVFICIITASVIAAYWQRKPA